MGHPRVELGSAIRSAYVSAGITQEEIAAELGIDQTTVSKWVQGQRWPPLDALPKIDRLCGKPRGHVLKLAGWVEDSDVDVIAAIKQDPALRDPIAREVMTELYRIFARRHVEQPDEHEMLATMAARVRKNRPQPEDRDAAAS